MFAAVRHYTELDAGLLDEIAGKAPAIRRAIASVPGARGCEVIRTREGLMVVAFADDEACVVEAGRRLAAWLLGAAPAMRSVHPVVWAGPVLAHSAAAVLEREATW